MLYPLQSLLNLRLYREDAAKAEVKLQEAILSEAKKDVLRCEEACIEYKNKIPELVEIEYATIIGFQCTLKDIEKVKEKVAIIEQKLVLLEEKLALAKEKVTQCEENVQKAREAVTFARKEAAKIEKHKEIWLEIEKKEAERLEDLEMEEFSGLQEQE